ncbi:MAG TPA: acetylglutamate kinase [Gemmatimonadaceae bacterium]|nr:acetylglutamate kinase [Gemmatimonadaceae bacterium]
MTRVVKIGGRAQGDARLAPALAAAARAGPRAPAAGTSATLCVVHGGGDEVSAVQRRLGLEPVFIGGRRVTRAEDLEVVRMVLSGTVNKRLVARLLAHGVRAVGISGEDAWLFAARATDAATMGRVGGIVSVDPAIVLQLVAGGFVPVVSPLARDADDAGGGALNVNGDDAAAALAVALKADELVFVADVPGVLEDGAVLHSLDVERAGSLVARGVAAGGMAAKLEAASAALGGGVAHVRIAGLDGISDPAAGTRIVLSPTPV